MAGNKTMPGGQSDMSTVEHEGPETFSLLEWLKHSKKKYCELCKHPFTFSPVYVEHMPDRLPIPVIVLGIGKTVFGAIQKILRYVYLVTVWLILMPVVTTATVSLFLGWKIDKLRAGDPSVIMIHVGAGLGITAAMVLLTMCLLLLRDFMLSHRLFRLRRRRRQRHNHQEAGEASGTGEVNRVGEAGRVGGVGEAGRVGGVGEAGRVGGVGEAGEVEHGHQAPRSAFTPVPAEAAISETTTRTNITRVSERSSWLQDVLPREYRAYLHRRELYRERFDRANSTADPSFHDVIQQSGADNINGDLASTSNSNRVSSSLNANRPATRTSIESGGVDTLDENGFAIPRWRRSQIREGNRGESLHVGGGIGSNVIFRDSIRCKICTSVVCTNKEHVIMASQRSHNQETPDVTSSSLQRDATSSSLQRGATPDNTTDTAPLVQAAAEPDMGNLHVETVVPERVAPQPVPLDRENNAGWNMWFDVDNNGGAMTFSEFIGISGSLISVLQNALVVVACNLSAIHVLVVVPYFATKAIFKGHLMSWMSFCIGTVNSFYSPSTYTGEEVDDLLWIKSTFSGIQEALSLHASFTFTFVSKFLIRVTEFLPNIILTNLVLLKKMLIASLDLFRFNKGSYVDYILQMTVGYVLVAGVGWLYRAMVLERKPKLEGVSRNIDQMLCLLGAFLKLAMLLVLILVIFPIYSGWVIDISLLPLFSSSFTDRLAFYNSHSLLSQLIHWTVGTIVLINISFLVSWLRTVLRPGLLFFISNSSDPDHMPIKDMIVTPLTVQINRYFRSLIVYGLALFGHFYGFSLICRLLVPKLTPLNFSFRNFTAEVPYDLLSNLFIKFLSDILNPGMVSKTTTAFMRLVIRSLRLSSYFHGGRYLSEESLAFGRWVFVPDFDRAYKLEKIEAMFNRPVQPWDIAKIEIVQGRESLNQLNQQSAQNMPVEPRRPRRPPAQIDRHDSTKGFTVVYRPNQFKIRVCAFLGAMFGIFQAFGLLMFVAPILVGRFVLGYFVEPGFSPYEFHTFQIGVIILGLCMKIGQMIYESVSQSGLKTVITSVLRVPIVAIKAVIVASTMFVLWPTLGGIYLMLVTTPFVSSLNETPTYPVFTCWVIGFMYARLLIMLRSMICSEKRARILDRLATFEGWWHMRFKEVILHLIVPYTVRALLLMFGPPMAVLLLSPLLELSFAQILMLQRWSYLLSLAVPFIAIGIWLIRNARQQFVNRIRDEHYLVGRRLHNLERPNAENRPVDTMPAVIA